MDGENPFANESPHTVEWCAWEILNGGNTLSDDQIADRIKAQGLLDDIIGSTASLIAKTGAAQALFHPDPPFSYHRRFPSRWVTIPASSRPQRVVGA